MNYIQKFKPKIPKRYLLFIAAIVWTFAGGMLLFRGISLLNDIKDFLWLIITISIIGGVFFYIALFSKISLKHTKRIIDLVIEKPCMFSFFNIRSYVLMAIMITSGILIRKSGIILPKYLSIIEITMGIPLFLSSIRFYYYGIYYHELINKEK